MTHRPALLAAALLALAPSAALSATVWTTIATEKILPATRARATTHARIAAARNEFEAFQVVVTGPASGVSASVSDLSGPGSIGGVKLYREALINLANPSSADGFTGRVPDALVPDVDEWGEKRNAFPFDVPAGESRAIWVEVYVPRDAKAGTYEGTVTVKSQGSADQQVPVTLTVWDFTLPSTASLRSAFILGYGSLPAAHGVAGGTDAMAALRQKYGAFALDHRISLPRHDDGDGSATMDHFDKWYGPLLNGTANTRLPGAKLTSVQYLKGSKLDYAAWAKHFRANGWFDRLYDYTCDEPPITCKWSDIPARTAQVHAADPQFKTLVTTQIQEANTNGVTNGIDILVPVVNDMEGKPGFKYAGPQRSAYDGFLKNSHNELWTYQSCMSHGCGGSVAIGDPSASAQYYTGWPSYVIDSSAIRSRAQEWLSFRWGATGELYFETTMAFTHDPWNNQWDFTGNGDGTLFYPGTPAKIGGTTHIPIASIRLKMIREGMEDFEYLKLLADDGDPSLAKAITEAVFPNAYTTDVSPDDLMVAREKIANRILTLTGKGTTVAGVSGAPAGSGSVLDGLPSDGDGAMLANAGGCSSGPGNAGFLALLGVPVLLRYLYRRRHRHD